MEGQTGQIDRPTGRTGPTNLTDEGGMDRPTNRSDGPTKLTDEGWTDRPTNRSDGGWTGAPDRPTEGKTGGRTESKTVKFFPRLDALKLW